MTDYVNLNIFISDIVADLHYINELFNEIGEQYIEPSPRDKFAFTKNQDWLHRHLHAGTEVSGSSVFLNEHGKRFLFALADFCDRQFPGER